ncbi:hypothetical protein TorRG33x02_014880 [Trema orientale]|uniref:Uncharacterized protein n=1 Tax=Trema orientale TaxID=63057 RepID=A0A2P5FXJ7_TREOI|nr:hypothetical protein TorRG33x02_014880 [Trema orientale]
MEDDPKIPSEADESAVVTRKDPPVEDDLKIPSEADESAVVTRKDPPVGKTLEALVAQSVSVNTDPSPQNPPNPLSLKLLKLMFKLLRWSFGGGGRMAGYIIFKSYHDVNTIFYRRFKNLDLWAAVAFSTFFFFVSSLILKEKTEASTKWFFC